MEMFKSIIHQFEEVKRLKTLDHDTDSPVFIRNKQRKAPPRSALPRKEFNKIALSVQKQSIFEDLISPRRSPKSTSIQSFNPSHISALPKFRRVKPRIPEPLNKS